MALFALFVLWTGIGSAAAGTAELPAVGSFAAVSAATTRLDSAHVHKLYLDGEFDTAIAILEQALERSPSFSHGDSVFIFKHLGVMFAAQYHTREKGKYYMHRLLEVEPSAKIMDMYASDMIYMIFKNIQEEYMQNHDYIRGGGNGSGLRPNPPEGAQGGTGNGAKAEPGKSHSRTWLWVGAGAAAAAGIGAYFLFVWEPEAKGKNAKF